jgi:disulfide bond formation protein DsbB
MTYGKPFAPYNAATLWLHPDASRPAQNNPAKNLAEAAMNSQIFPNNTNTNSDQARSYILPLWYSTAGQWLSIIMLIAIVILFPERPAWGG